MTSSGQTDRTELFLRISRRSLVALLVLILLIAATLIAHVVRPGSLLADWASRMPWLLPVAIVAVFVMFIAPLRRSFPANDPDVETVVNDEFRQANLARAQRVALVVVLVAQIPLAIFLSGLSAVAAVTVMGVATITIASATFIIAFLFADRG
jgi:Na+/H+ antiporter NhaC